MPTSASRRRSAASGPGAAPRCKPFTADRSPLRAGILARRTRSQGVPCANATTSLAPCHWGNAVRAVCAPAAAASTLPSRKAAMARGAGEELDVRL